MTSRRIKVDYLARVEGEGGLDIRVRDGRVRDVKLNIFEPPRLFEGFLRGRHFSEVPDITARICGICPVAYQMSATHAMEAAFDIPVNGPLRDLRRLLYCGEWIESHVLHAFLLHAPDFLGYQDAIAMAKDHKDIVETGLRLKKYGNEIVTVLGGREIHPINVRVGGFYRVPTRAELGALTEHLAWGLDASVEAVQFAAGLPFPDFEQHYTYVGLRHPDEYPFCEGRVVSSDGLDISIDEFEDWFREHHVSHSTALHATLRDAPYLVGPLARFNLNFDLLSPRARQAAEEVGVVPPENNPFRSIVVRLVETVHAFEEALRIVEAYEPPAASFVEGPVNSATGHGCTEAPRGILYHRYSVDDEGLVTEARIVPPTSQNQARVEEDLRAYLPGRLDLPAERLTWECEQLVRNYDPCISCSTHSLKLRVHR